MKSITEHIQGEELFVGIHLHKRRWHDTIRTVDVEVFSSCIAGRWEHLRKLLNRYDDCHIHAVYETEYLGFWLFDFLTHDGSESVPMHSMYTKQRIRRLSALGFIHNPAMIICR